MEIKENEVYTPKEAQEILKVSQSTVTRMIKTGLIRTAKIGKQYRILGKELLRLLSPKLENQVGKLYNKGRKWIHEGIDEPVQEIPKVGESQ
ncbi:MAG TPA: helix-turn-helix domain-containing protein [bacterium]|nr:helix-turn-helix domain-containing protein [bacterium]